MLRLQHAAQIPAQVHLTGEGADALFGTAPSYLVDLARRGNVRTLLRHCAAQARLRQQSTFDLARRARRAACGNPADALAALAVDLRQAHSPRQLGWADSIAWWPLCHESAGWLTRQARRELADLAASVVVDADVACTGPAEVASRMELRVSADTQRYVRELGAATGVQVHAPYLDDAVVRRCLRVATPDRVVLNTYKPLLARAMSGLVPQPVLDRRTKGDYTAELYVGARRASSTLNALIDGSRLADLGVIEPAAVSRTLERLLAGVQVPFGSLNMLLAAEVWLRVCTEASLPAADLTRS
jgi:asparagine synthase (glutamine-hydrolysing)